MISLLSGVRRQTGTEMFSVGDEKYWSTAAASAVSAACSMLATEKALSPIRRRVGGTTRSTDDEARSADRAGTSTTHVSKSDVYIGVCRRNDLWTIRHNLCWILCATGSQCNSWRAWVTRSRCFRSRTVGAYVYRTL